MREIAEERRVEWEAKREVNAKIGGGEKREVIELLDDDENDVETIEHASGEWTCKKCTLRNQPCHLQCNVCEAPRNNNSAVMASNAFPSQLLPPGGMVDNNAFASHLPPGIVDMLGSGKAVMVAYNPSSDPSSTSLPPGILGTLLNKRHHREVEAGEEWDSGGWIWVNDPEYKNRYPEKDRNDSDEDVQRFIAEYKKIEREGGMREDTKKQARRTHAAIIELAKRHNVLHGKWLLYVKAELFDVDWPNIRDAVLKGKLGPTAKISDSPENGMHVVCVYCPDFTDQAELLRVRRAIMNEVPLRSLVTPHSMRQLWFKTDAFTYLGKYHDPKSKLRTTTFDCGGEIDLNCTTLQLGSADCTSCEDCPKCYPRCLGLREDQVYSVVGLNHAEAHGLPGETVKLVRDPENVSISV